MSTSDISTVAEFDEEGWLIQVCGLVFVCVAQLPLLWHQNCMCM
jgi:hypothetical protein